MHTPATTRQGLGARGTAPWIGALRGSRDVVWLGLGLFVAATVGLPALHVLEHLREAAEEEEEAAEHAEEAEHALGHNDHDDHDDDHHHHRPGHHHHGEEPGEPHGRGALQHFGIAVLASAPPLLPPRSTTAEPIAVALGRDRITATKRTHARTSRGPPACGWSL